MPDYKGKKATMTIMKLSELAPLQSGHIVKIHGAGPLRQRMMDMGLVPGAKIKVVRVAPLGDPVEYEVKGYHLSLRSREAQNILVEVEVMTLEQIKSPGEVKMIDVNGGRHLVRILSEMGLVPGKKLKMIENPPKGPLVINVSDMDYQIGQGMARKILVEPINGKTE